ncbi:dipeptide transporter; membrane component of ABC superfamily [Paraburkholderia piptadeniae]|uniref:Dipeptide transporter membrane component of ABC superfamily n=2 Tax=Paraburkholderia piptadeniae TaxID=1701573 RepID=A0A1N7SR13_9BURK|nr:dipeptide transporter; membrane component of ABC superfamily [Paraburkholderia piptadeniae]
MWRWDTGRLRAHALVAFGCSLMLLLILVACFGQVWGLPNPNRIDLASRIAAPTVSWHGPGLHPFGTDQLGRDLVSRIVAGSRMTLMIAGCAVALGGIVGISLGLVSGYFGGWIDKLLMRLVDIQLAFPLMLLALLIVSVSGPSVTNLILVLSLTSWVRYTRVIRSSVLSIRKKEFILSAHAIGAGHLRIITRHILPNVLASALVVGTLELARTIVLEAGLSFLGLGVQPPAASWGRMLADGRVYIDSAWWIITMPGIALVLTVLGANLLGDGLRELLDPRRTRK